VSESRGEGQPEGSAQPSKSDQPSSSQPSSSGQPSSAQPSRARPASSSGQPKTSGNGQSGGAQSGGGQSGSGRGQSRPSDPVADFQRWLMKAGARSMANQVADQVRRTVGAERKPSGDVWDTATNEVPPNEAAECQWCPVCQAARAARTGGATGLGAALSGAGTVLSSVVQDAFSVFEQVMKTQDQNQNRSAERTGGPRPGTGAPDGGESGQ